MDVQRRAASSGQICGACSTGSFTGTPPRRRGPQGRGHHTITAGGTLPRRRGPPGPRRRGPGQHHKTPRWRTTPPRGSLCPTAPAPGCAEVASSCDRSRPGAQFVHGCAGVWTVGVGAAALGHVRWSGVVVRPVLHAGCASWAPPLAFPLGVRMDGLCAPDCDHGPCPEQGDGAPARFAARRCRVFLRRVAVRAVVSSLFVQQLCQRLGGCFQRGIQRGIGERDAQLVEQVKGEAAGADEFFFCVGHCLV